LAQSFKICPICGTHSHPNAAVCSTCGTSLADVPLASLERTRRSDDRRTKTGQNGYDRRYGETDLIEDELARNRSIYVVSALIVLPMLVCFAVLAVQGIRSFTGGDPIDTPIPTATIAPVSTVGGGADIVSPSPQTELQIATNTMVAPRLATVTPMPPTATATPTQGPCEVLIRPGDDLISLAFSCGHRSLDVLPEILELNNLSAPEAIIAGTTLLIPWPTPTVDPNAQLPTEGNADTAQAGGELIAAAAVQANSTATAQSIFDEPTPTETLLEGIMWHTVQTNETMLAIAYQYNTSAEVLSQLNPEITFSQCDYSLDSGGPRCTVLLQSGQRMRVPAPSPTPTLSPTLTGSETPIPSATPTFNAPNALSPSHRALFQRDQLITLRWIASGTLRADEVYVVKVRDLTTDMLFTATTTQLFWIVPPEWQGTDARRHDYEWTVSVARADDLDNPRFTTEARQFTWQGRGETNS